MTITHSTPVRWAPFGARLKMLRKSWGLTQRGLAREVWCSGVTICQLEFGRVEPGADLLARLAAVFGLTMDELWHGNTAAASGQGERDAL